MFILVVFTLGLIPTVNLSSPRLKSGGIVEKRAELRASSRLVWVAPCLTVYTHTNVFVAFSGKPVQSHTGNRHTKNVPFFIFLLMSQLFFSVFLIPGA